MALVVKDRLQETSTTTGTGTFTLAGAVSGFQSFSAIGNGNTTYYSITDGTNWEVGIGTYTSSGTTLSRDTVLESSNSDNLVDFGAGSKFVFCTYPADKSVYADASSKVSGYAIENSTIGATTASTGKFTSVTTPSVTATTDNLTLSAISTGKINLNTATANQVQITDATAANGQYTLLSRDNTANEQRISGAATTGGVNFGISSAVAGSVKFYTNGFTELQAQVARTASAVNYVQVTGAATSANPVISAQGSDSTVNLSFQRKGNGNFQFLGPVILGSNAVNYWQTSGAATTLVPQLQVLGSDTNISMALQPKGTGAIDLAAGSSGVNISNGGTVTAITRTNVGANYTTNPSVVISAPTTAGGVQATATVPIGAASFTVSNGGTGYAVGNVLTMVGGTFTSAGTCTVSAVSGGVITAVTATSTGTYTAAPTNPASVTGGAGSGATFTLNFGVLSTFTITNAGSGYIEQPTVTFSGGGGSGASAYATVGSMPIIRSLAGSAAAGDSLSFYTPAGESVRIRDQGVTSNGYIQLQGSSATSNGSYLTSSAGSLYVSCAGTNAIGMFTNGQGGTRQFNITHTASAVNYVQVTGAATLNPPVISAQGSDSTVALLFQAKGGQNIRFYSAAGSAEQFRIIHTAGTIANYTQATGNVAGSAPAFSVNGSDTNIDLALTPKGTGVVQFGSYTATVTAVAGYITIKDSGGTTRKLAVLT